MVVQQYTKCTKLSKTKKLNFWPSFYVGYFKANTYIIPVRNTKWMYLTEKCMLGLFKVRWCCDRHLTSFRCFFVSKMISTNFLKMFAYSGIHFWKAYDHWNKVHFNNCTHKWCASTFSRLQSIWKQTIPNFTDLVTTKKSAVKSGFHLSLYVLSK